MPKADIWCFGFPCQDISVAGKQGGFTNGKRSSLFFTVTGLLRELKEEDRPSYLFIENVKNLLSINKGWDFGKLQIELDEIGYDVEWGILDSAEIVPQHRERIYIIGRLRGRGTGKVFPITGENKSTISSVRLVGDVSKTGKHQSGMVYDAEGLSPTLSARDYKDPVKIVRNSVKQLGNISDSKGFGGNPQVGRVYSIAGVSPTLNTMQGGGREPKILDDQGRTSKRLKPLDVVPTLRAQSHGNEPKVMQQALYGKKTAIATLTPDRINKRQNGRRFKTDGEPMFTLTSQDRHGVYNGFRIRKLTPLECWRLQGFPDWAFKKAEAVNSNSQLYKQAGNSVTVPVIKRIAENFTLESSLKNE